MLNSKALVVSHDKGKHNENDTLNFGTVSILKIRFQILMRDRVTKTQLLMAWKMFSHHKFLHIEKTVIHSMS